MKKTGQLLKDKREAAKLTISEVALATKINPKILTAMENGDETSLPSKTFLKGFLKAYATFLKIDQEEVLRTYQEEMGPPPPERVHEINKPVPAPTGSAPKVERRRMGEENSSGLRTAAVVVIVLLIGVIIGVRELIEKYQREKLVESSAIKVSPLEQPPLVPEVKPAEPSNPPPPPPPTNALATPPGPAALPLPDTPPPKPAQNDMIVSPSAPPPPPKTEDAKSTPPVPPPPKAEEHKVPPPKDEVPPATDTVNTDPAPQKKTSKNEIILEALDKVDVKFQIKGETKRVSLGPTQVHTIYSDQPVTLDLSDGGAVNVILNGRERGVPGDLGKPKQIKIP
ncbi:MAG: helix-turn-helix domain-containing protein [Bdellovibrionales bacterium]